MYTPKQVNLHMQFPQVGDIWTRLSDGQEIFVFNPDKVDRKLLANECAPKHLVAAKTLKFKDGDRFIEETDEDEIQIVEISNGMIYYRFIGTDVIGNLTIEDFNSCLKNGNIRRIPIPRNGWFDYVSQTHKYRLAYFLKDGAYTWFVDGGGRSYYKSEKKFLCYIESLDKGEIQESITIAPGQGSFFYEDGFNIKRKASFSKNEGKRIAFKDGDSVGEFLHEEDFLCWLNSMRKV